MTDTSKPKVPKHFDVLTFNTSCPSCGGKVEFASAGSVLAVCDYCQSNVVRKGEEVSLQGKQSFLVEDYSPLQIGSSGEFAGQQFVVIGRIQFQYDAGIWNEWYVQFAQGQLAWLSEALGEYTFAFEKTTKQQLARYRDYDVNSQFYFDDNIFTVTDKRTAQAIAGEGELPFVVGDGWSTWVIDARFNSNFITLDYAEKGCDKAPIVYAGKSVVLHDLNMQFLKTTDQINDNNSQDNSNIDKLDCPNCAAVLSYVPAMTSCVVCEYCHSEIEMAGDTANVVEFHSTMQALESSLPLGAKARFNSSQLSGLYKKGGVSGSHDYVILGIQKLDEIGEYQRWTEYLLYSVTNGFLWLVEYNSTWKIARVLNELPQKKGYALEYDNQTWHRVYDECYQSRVLSAYGAFSWKVRLNDIMTLEDFQSNNRVITSEQNVNEISYTLTAPISKKLIQELFVNQYSQIDNYAHYDEYDDEDAPRTNLSYLFFGLCIVWFFCIGFATIFINLIFFILGLITIVMLSQERHEFDSEQITKIILTDRSSSTRISIFVIIGLSFVVSFVLRPSSDNNNSSSNSGYAAGGRIGYFSSGSHK